MKGSLLQSIPASLSQMVHAKLSTWSKQVDLSIALTGFGRNMLVRHNFDAGKVVVKPNYIVDNQLSEPQEERTGAVFVGRLSIEKGICFLLESWGELADVPLHIIGDGPEMENLVNLANTMGLESVSFHGMLPHNEVIKHIQASQFLIMPSLWYETFGLGIVEAFSCGTPVLASRHGAMESLINEGDNGLLFKPGNRKDLVEKVRLMLSDETERKKMANNARDKYVRDYSKSVAYGNLMRCYTQAIDNALAQQ